MRGRFRHVIVLASWTGFLVAALVALHALGDGLLATPPMRAPGAWLAERGPAILLFALLRLTLLAVGWYLLVSTLLAAALRLARADLAAAAVEACAPTPLRWLVGAAAGLSLAASVVVVPAAAAVSEGDEPVTMRRLPDVSLAGLDHGDAPVTMTLLPNEGATPPSPTPPAPPAARTWTVAPGEHLWAIAERLLGADWQRAPSDDEIDPYWRRLVEHNRHTLPDPANPDLILPGMAVRVPELPPKPAH